MIPVPETAGSSRAGMSYYLRSPARPTRACPAEPECRA